MSVSLLIRVWNWTLRYRYEPLFLVLNRAGMPRTSVQTAMFMPFGMKTFWSLPIGCAI